MPTISMSNDFFNGPSGGFVSRIANFNNANRANTPSGDFRSIAAMGHILGGASGSLSGGNAAIAQIHVMRGVPPATLIGLDSFATRSADVLVSFTTLSSISGATALDFAPSQAGVGVHPIIINTNYVFATGSGTATWFWWVNRSVPSGNTAISNNIVNQFMGTVGTPGSGSDLELPITNITAGQAYRIRNLVLSFPQSWSW